MQFRSRRIPFKNDKSALIERTSPDEPGPTLLGEMMGGGMMWGMGIGHLLILLLTSDSGTARSCAFSNL